MDGDEAGALARAEAAAGFGASKAHAVIPEFHNPLAAMGNAAPSSSASERERLFVSSVKASAESKKAAAQAAKEVR